MMGVVWVFLGGGLGSVARYGLSRWLNPEAGTLPAGTLLANVLACAIVGFAMGWVALRGPMQENARLLLLTGFCGGFSTFSTFSGESLALFQSGKPGLAIVYVLSSVVACLGAAGLAYWIGKH